MSLQYLETNVIAAYLIDAWQNHLQTESDPTSGKWFRQGPNNSNGLFGGLTDVLLTDLVFEPGQSNVNKSKELALSTTLDNRAGLLNDSSASNTLTWQITKSATTTQSRTNSIKSSLQEKISATVEIPEVAKIGMERTFSIEYAYSWASSEAVVEAKTTTLSTTVPMKVPQGKVYKLVIVADRNSLSIPYHAQVRIKGVSEANFAHAVNGQTQWRENAGAVCSWIKKYGSAGADAMTFDADPNQPDEGIGAIRGVMRVDQSVNFTIIGIDVTDTFAADPKSSAAIKALLNGEALPKDQIVSQLPVTA